MDFDKIIDLVENFSDYIGCFKLNNPFSGPSEYFYIHKIISVTKKGYYNSVFTKPFIEYIYATLALWGMDRMGPDNKGAKMNDFNSFQKCIMKNKINILKLKSLNINEINIDDIMPDIKKLYIGLWSLMKSNSKLVATSKVMHFLLPYLIPPMDREYTMKFFNKQIPTIESDKDSKNIEKEFAIFEYVLRKVQYISKHVECSKFIDEEFSPTIPKVIDNAIVSYIRKDKLSKKQILFSF